MLGQEIVAKQVDSKQLQPPDGDENAAAKPTETASPAKETEFLGP